MLAEAGLKRINISLDTLSIERFHEIARSDAVQPDDGRHRRRREEAGLWPIKLNMVVMKGHNDDEVVDFARLAREKGYEVRFIEFMPLDGDGIWRPDQVVPSRRIQERIEDLFPLVGRRRRPARHPRATTVRRRRARRRRVHLRRSARRSARPATGSG